MAFCSEVDHIVAFPDQFIHDFLIPYVPLDEGVVIPILYVLKVFKVSAVGQCIKVDDMVV